MFVGDGKHNMESHVSKKSSLKQIVFFIVLVVAVVLFVVGFIAKDKKSGGKIITKGDKAPEFRLPDMKGQIINLSDLKGKVVIIHFWATWCPPCVEEIPTLSYLNEQLAGTDFVLLAISVDENGAQGVAPFLKQKGLNLPVLLDPDRVIASRYGTFKFPETYILDRAGIVQHKIIGPADWRDPSAIKLLKDMIASR
jgi:cytochrome c biogenesis protein CcmG/thiol:disulfide interchange protein DsbE